MTPLAVWNNRRRRRLQSPQKGRERERRNVTSPPSFFVRTGKGFANLYLFKSLVCYTIPGKVCLTGGMFLNYLVNSAWGWIQRERDISVPLPFGFDTLRYGKGDRGGRMFPSSLFLSFFSPFKNLGMRREKMKIFFNLLWRRYFYLFQICEKRKEKKEKENNPLLLSCSTFFAATSFDVHSNFPKDKSKNTLFNCGDLPRRGNPKHFFCQWRTIYVPRYSRSTCSIQSRVSSGFPLSPFKLPGKKVFFLFLDCAPEITSDNYTLDKSFSFVPLFIRWYVWLGRTRSEKESCKLFFLVLRMLGGKFGDLRKVLLCANYWVRPCLCSGRFRTGARMEEEEQLQLSSQKGKREIEATHHPTDWRQPCPNSAIFLSSRSPKKETKKRPYLCNFPLHRAAKRSLCNPRDECGKKVPLRMCKRQILYLTTTSQTNEPLALQKCLQLSHSQPRMVRIAPRRQKKTSVIKSEIFFLPFVKCCRLAVVLSWHDS